MPKALYVLSGMHWVTPVFQYEARLLFGALLWLYKRNAQYCAEDQKNSFDIIFRMWLG
jgi:hypothetical protein